jgi:hypothetical protein
VPESTVAAKSETRQSSVNLVVELSMIAASVAELRAAGVTSLRAIAAELNDRPYP